MTGIKYPEIRVQLTGTSGNAFAIIGFVLRDVGVPPDEVADFMEKATGGDYDHPLQTAMRWLPSRRSRRGR